MTVQVYRSTDASAPVLTGQVGTLVALLDACLVTGYGAKAAAGWTKPLTGTNKAAFRQNATGANNSASPMYLYVDDNGPGAGGAREARVCGFETMSAITPTGTGQFPTAAQSAIGVGTLTIRKSTTADATARTWTLVANGQTFYLFVESGDFVAPLLGPMPFVFGDVKSYKSSDIYAVTIIGRAVENTSNVLNDPFQVMVGSTGWNLSSKYWGHFMARSWTGLGGSIQVGKTFNYGIIGNGILGGWSSDLQTAISGTQQITSGRNVVGDSRIFPAPNGPDGAIWLSPIWMHHSQAVRGYLPGLWATPHDRPLTHNDSITIAAGSLSGKTLLCQNFCSWSNQQEFGQVFLETSDTWT
jgi:hypothetical protein